MATSEYTPNVNNHTNIWLFYYNGNKTSIFDDMINGNYLSVYDWGKTGNLKDKKDTDEISQSIVDKIPSYTKPGGSAAILNDLINRMKLGDYVICRNKEYNTIIAWGIVNSEYKYVDSDKRIDNHRIGVSWQRIEYIIPENMISKEDMELYSKRLENLNETIWAPKIVEILKKDNIKRIENKPISSINMEEVSILKQKKQIILQGAPGTGKTYKTAAIAVAICDGEDNTPSDRKTLMNRYKQLVDEKRIAFTTFHQSMDYEEFVEGIKPVAEEGSITYEVKDGIFCDICNRALKAQTIDANDNFEEVWSNLINYLEDHFYMDVLLLTGGKTFRVELNETGTGLANRTYPTEDFSKGDWIEGKSKFFSKEQLYNVYRGLKGIPTGGHDNYRRAIIKHLKNEFGLVEYKEGKSSNTDTNNFVLIIDEINRANISKVMGELITLLETDKRLGEQNEVKAWLPYSKKEFGVPTNLYIIGTMNTADRSVGYIDYAIRRRFAFITIKAQRDVVEDYNSTTSKLALEYFDKVKSWMCEDNVIGNIAPDDLMVGHSYFLADNLQILKTKMKYEVIPLLLEYINDGILNTDLKKDIKAWEDNL